MNYKKELGLSLKEIKEADWFKQLPYEDQQAAIEMQKRSYTPPDATENTMLNVWISQRGKWGEWVKECLAKWDWADPSKSGGEVRLAKREFFARIYVEMKRGAV